MIGVDLTIVEKILNDYPLLETVLQGGIVSKKMCRELLEIDRATMDKIYSDLILAQAVMGTSSSCFKAKSDTIKYLRERRRKRNESESK